MNAIAWSVVGLMFMGAILLSLVAMPLPYWKRPSKTTERCVAYLLGLLLMSFGVLPISRPMSIFVGFIYGPLTLIIGYFWLRPKLERENLETQGGEKP